MADRPATAERSFRRLYDDHAPAVNRFLRDLLRDVSAADEATQETFVRAHAGLAKLEKADRVQSWLFGIARNVAYEAMRARKRVVLLPEQEMPAGDGPPPPDPEALLLGREADAVLGTALAGLSEDRRAALLLAIDHGLPYAEIAEVMGWSLAKVKVEIHRARLVLRAHVARIWSDPGEKSPRKDGNEDDHVV